MGTPTHSDWRLAISSVFHERRDQWRCDALWGVIYQKGPHCLIADVAVSENHFDDDVVPLAIFEVLESFDTHSTVMHGLAAFEAMGVSQVWLADPARASVGRYLNGKLSFTESQFHHGHIQFDVAEIINYLQAGPTSKVE